MTGTTFFQIFILLDVFIMGLLAATALRHAQAHFRPIKPQSEKPNVTTINEPLPTVVKERLIQASQEQFQVVLNNSADFLQRDLEATSEQISNLIDRLATEIVSDELDRYRKDLAQLHNQAAAELGNIKKEMDGHQAELKEKLAQEILAEKQLLIKQINTKLSDAVGSFLLEALQHNIDLGSQSSYLIALLEEHKADFIKEVIDEAQSE